MSELTEIHWPDYYHPKNSSVHVKEKIVVPSEGERIWACIVQAPCWPNWHHRKTAVQITKGDTRELHKGTMFNWITKTMSFECTVVEYIPHERIAWKGKCGDVDIYHAWLLSPCDNGCRIVTESTQRGGLRWLTGRFVTKQVAAHHHQWLHLLCEQAKG
ncbi:SRPBCC domain-containing protein [Vibrio barjaei]|uniref:SRPBCC domain-containing protein n=1 Tax=Vibrio barjaei TaxID=1676683 RepID=UPI0007BB32DB|nr:SRPBCC domain-containing protein [Vibrio barjaei]OIN26865.1 polyketide cyclase [Vibrio barjaei]